LSARRSPGTNAMRAVAAAGVLVVVWLSARMATRGAGTVRLAPTAAVTRDGRRVAGIERVTRARGRGRLPLYLAPARGPVIDSARVGTLAARLVAGTETGTAPQVALVPRDSVGGLALVGRLVVVPGEPGLLVFGAGSPHR
jgi:hypothetical protein